jgi:hypothetical protein
LNTTRGVNYITSPKNQHPTPGSATVKSRELHIFIKGKHQVELAEDDIQIPLENNDNQENVDEIDRHIDYSINHNRLASITSTGNMPES